ncbi:hypothetical protein KAJ83_06845 [Marivibrio halodurans]|uniref:Lipoprotein n=1 Tax=Marivibrio halodurans TaxID=2039722 RepID=A0A8J7S4R2_9PROT|nr:hypothetical protein [Marivibrio halodurans]MBP5856719.1 hypothetical protein [Marivibrio halodurans]
MHYRDRIARRTTTARALLLLAPLLAIGACNGATTQWAQSQGGSAHEQTGQRLAAQGNPRFDDPAKAAIVQRFESDYQRFGRTPDRIAVGAGAEVCPIEDRQRAYRWITGESLARIKKRMESVNNVTYVADLDSIRIRMVSGTCEMLRTGGEVTFVADMSAVRRHGDAGGQRTALRLRESVFRVTGTMRDGERAAVPFRTIESLVTTLMQRGESGEFEVYDGGEGKPDPMLVSPTGIYTYVNDGAAPDSALKITFRRQPETNDFATYVEEPRGDGSVSGTNFNGAELRYTYGLKDGRLHGWYKIHSYTENGYTVPASTICYQHGEKVKTTTCPTT